MKGIPVYIEGLVRAYGRQVHGSLNTVLERPVCVAYRYCLDASVPTFTSMQLPKIFGNRAYVN